MHGKLVGKYTIFPWILWGISHLQALGSLGIPMNQVKDVSNLKNPGTVPGAWHMFEQINPIL